MGKTWGTLKYILFAPLARPYNFFKYGGSFVALESAFSTLSTANTVTANTSVQYYISYLTTKYVPPQTIEDALIPIVVGAVIAGIKWRTSVW